MISINNISVEFGTRPLFQNASVEINAKEKMALVGKNGAGKSTLLKILAGQMKPTEGEVAIMKDCTVGYLPQVMKIADDCTVMEEAEKAFEHINKLAEVLEREKDELEKRTDVDSEDYLQLVESFSHHNEYFDMVGGAQYKAVIERTLVGLGFKHEDFERPTKEFSGGWRMRIELAKLLMQSPDVLLLDEPTNHLDIESIAWLENFLLRSPSAVVLVSHDRAFINNVTNRTLEISCGRIFDYKVKYDQYVNLRAERREQQLRAYENQQKEIADIKSFIEQFRYKPTKAVQVQSRIKQLEKIIPIEVDEVEKSTLRLKFAPCTRSGDYPLICEEVEKSYGDHVVFNHVDLRIARGEKVAFVGQNGAGKSTLVKCIMQEIEHGGKLTVGHNVQIGYYAQNQAQLLDENLTIYETIDRIATGDVRLRINDILGAFMFGGELAEKQVKVLSGGERSRLAMIQLLLSPVNFLILDEPTNHLDMRSKDALKDAILDFEGTVVVVSHDRYFLDGLVTKVYEFGEQKVREHLGGIYDFLEKKNMDHLQELEKPTTQKAKQEEAQNEGKERYEQLKNEAKQKKKYEKQVKACELRIENIEKKLQEIETQLSTPEGACNASLGQEYGNCQKELEEAMGEWEEAIELMG